MAGQWQPWARQSASDGKCFSSCVYQHSTNGQQTDAAEPTYIHLLRISCAIAAHAWLLYQFTARAVMDFCGVKVPYTIKCLHNLPSPEQVTCQVPIFECRSLHIHSLLIAFDAGARVSQRESQVFPDLEKERSGHFF